MSTTLRRISAILFADIVGFTRLTSEDDAGAMRIVGELQECARRCLQRDGGRIVRFVGDAVLAEFTNSATAVRCGIGLERTFARRSAEAGHPCALRVGIHMGELTEGTGGEIYGAAVNLAARVQAQAGAGEVFVTDKIWDALSALPEFTFEEIGARELKGIDRPVMLYRALMPDAGTAGTAEMELASATPPDASPAAVTSGARAQTSAAVHLVAQSTTPASGSPPQTRLIVLPFRVLRPDPEIDFLAFGLADAVTTSLSGIRSLVVRSSLAAQRYATGQVDLHAIARETEVDLILAGTLLRAGDRVRVSAQLTAADSGTVLWSESEQVELGDLFQLQDVLTQRIVASVATPLTARERRMLRQDVPATAKAYEFYIRANELAWRTGGWAMARELYRAALAEDPLYAPAWARVGRAHRIVAKYALDVDVAARELALAEQAFARALELNPDLPMAHNLLAQHEVERGRPREAMIRLLKLRRMTGPNAEVYAGLVHALRYCGLLEESLSAHRAARQLDPTVNTSFTYTLLGLGRWEELLEAADKVVPGNVRETAMAMLGRLEEATAAMRTNLAQFDGAALEFARAVVVALEAKQRGQKLPDEVFPLALMERFPDPEGLFVFARFAAFAGSDGLALNLLDRIVERYYCEPQLREDPWFEDLRSRGRLDELIARAEAGRERSLTSYFELSGPELLQATPAAA